MPRKRARRTKEPARRSLPAALTDPRCYGRGVTKVRTVETHVSWVFLTGRYAYKIKKPVKLPFVDFSTLALRRHFCREELRVNRRLAPALYLAVVPIGGSRAAPRIGRKPAIEYAVKMREFATAARLDRRLAAKRLPRAALAEFGARLARFHAGLRPVRGVAADEIGATALRNIDELAEYLDRGSRSKLATLRAWTQLRGARLGALFASRAAAGAHRECHGDLHLQNLLWRDGAIMAFDALEFDRKLRDIDVISEVAFLAMDLHAHERADLSYEFMNRYLEVSGDYRGVDVLPFYLVQRALVRAKVAAIKRAQAAPDERGHDHYLATALKLAASTKPLLVITHGLSGSGKTSVDRRAGGPPSRTARPLRRGAQASSWPRSHGADGLERGRRALRGRRVAAYLCGVSRHRGPAPAQWPKRPHRRDVPAPPASGSRSARSPRSTRRVSRFSIARPRWPSFAGASRRVTARAATRRRPIAPSSSTSCSRRNLSIARNGASP